MSKPIVELKSVDKSFHSTDGTARLVLQDVDFTLNEGEIVALLGQSGSGKSTMLRIMAGLIPADKGQVLYQGMPIYGAARGISMVFQSFALFPWLTVQKNVELGLEAQGVSMKERVKRAQAAIEMALVMEPEVLLMDEAFSALDVLTGERLREDILELWNNNEIPTKAILIVSHNIEEAVMMADRVLIFASDPGRVCTELPITIRHPRVVESQEVRALIDNVYGLITSGTSRLGRLAEVESKLQLGDRLPEADIARMEGMLELLAEEPFNGRADLPKLAEDTELTDKELIDVSRALTILGFVQLPQGDVVITELGIAYVASTKAERQQIFGKQLLANVPMIAYIRHGLEQDPSGDLPEDLFLKLLRFTLNQAEAERALSVAIEWGRYGDVFEYNFNTGVIHMPKEDQATVDDIV